MTNDSERYLRERAKLEAHGLYRAEDERGLPVPADRRVGVERRDGEDGGENDARGGHPVVVQRVAVDAGPNVYRSGDGLQVYSIPA